MNVKFRVFNSGSVICMFCFVCTHQECVSPVLWKFCNQIQLAFKVKFPGGSQSLCWVPRLGNLLWTLELLQQCKKLDSCIQSGKTRPVATCGSDRELLIAKLRLK